MTDKKLSGYWIGRAGEKFRQYYGRDNNQDAMRQASQKKPDGEYFDWQLIDLIAEAMAEGYRRGVAELAALEAELEQTRQGYERHIEEMGGEIMTLQAQLATLKEPWIRIEYDEELEADYIALMEVKPPVDKMLILHCHSWDKKHKEVVLGYWSGEFFHNGENYPFEEFDLVPYAYQPWPDPAPYPEDKVHIFNPTTA